MKLNLGIDWWESWRLYSEDSNQSDVPKGSLLYSVEAGSGKKLVWMNPLQLYGNYNTVNGIRPIVTLKLGIKTNLTADTEFLGKTCWKLK